MLRILKTNWIPNESKDSKRSQATAPPVRTPTGESCRLLLPWRRGCYDRLDHCAGVGVGLPARMLPVMLLLLLVESS